MITPTKYDLVCNRDNDATYEKHLPCSQMLMGYLLRNWNANICEYIKYVDDLGLLQLKHRRMISQSKVFQILVLDRTIILELYEML